MSLALTVSDNADGTGGVATLSGTGGAAAGVFYAPFTGQLGSPAWQSAGGRTGDGTLAVAPGTGYYWWYAQIASGISNLAYQNLTDGTQAVHRRCLAAVQTQIQALALPGLAPAGVVLAGWLAHWRQGGIDPALPLVEVAVGGAAEEQPGVLTNVDDIAYPVAVHVVDASNRNYGLNLARYLLWRQRIFRAFRHQRLPGVPEVFTCDVTPDHVVDEKQFQDNYFRSSMLLRFRSREPRGFGA